MQAAASDRPSRIAAVVMGVSGCGKSTVAAGLADALSLHFIDGDALHLRIPQPLQLQAERIIE